MALVPVSDQMKAKILEMRQRDLTSSEISLALGGNPTPGQVAAVIAWETMRGKGTEIAGTEGVEAQDTLISLERDLQRALRANIEQIEPGLKAIDGGKEHTVNFGGRIDILAEDQTGKRVVIEIKVGTADRETIGQVLSYMGAIVETSSTVRGIVVAGDFAPPAISAARMTPNLRLLKYSHRFSFDAVSA